MIGAEPYSISRKMYYGHLRGNPEYLFKQSTLGGVSHILIDATEVLEAFAAGPPFPDNLRVDTWCGRNYKYGSYSNIIQRDGSVRNGCEYCFVEYSPEEVNKIERKEREAEQRARSRSAGEVHPSDLPF